LLPRSFRLLVLTQFLTVFNDNAFKQTVLLLALANQDMGGDPQARAGLVFALPFLLFAVFAGDLADRTSKRNLLLYTKWVEAGVMALATYSLWRGDLALGMAALFLMGMQSAFLGPAKYGIVPELVSNKQLSDANGLLQASVMVGILLGTGSAGFLKLGLASHLWVAGLLFTLIALVGVWVAHGITPPPPADPNRRLHFNPITRLKLGLQLASKTAGLLPAIFGHGIFWLVGGLGLFAWNEVGSEFAQVNEGLWTAGLASLSVSVGLGSLLAGRLSRQRPRPSFITRGAAAMAIGYCFVYWGPHDPLVVWIGCLASNFFMGFYLIPLKAILQSLPAATEKGRIQGAGQMMDWTFIVGASLVKWCLSGIGIRGMDIFPVMAGIMAVTALFLRLARPMAKMKLG